MKSHYNSSITEGVIWKQLLIFFVPFCLVPCSNSCITWLTLWWWDALGQRGAGSGGLDFKFYQFAGEFFLSARRPARLSSYRNFMARVMIYRSRAPYTRAWRCRWPVASL